jgi:hypothetical protein
MKAHIDAIALATALAKELQGLVPQGIEVKAEDATVFAQSVESGTVGGADLAAFVPVGADLSSVAHAVERAMDAIQDFIATETGVPWPVLPEAPNELAVPTVVLHGDQILPRYVWKSGESIELGRIPAVIVKNVEAWSPPPSPS